jgi:hypothetical protein
MGEGNLTLDAKPTFTDQFAFAIDPVEQNHIFVKELVRSTLS